MKVVILFYSTLLFLLFISCDDNGIENSEVYSGITETASDSPDPIGNIDPDDWLVPPPDTGIVHIPMVYAAWPAFPNPANRFTTFQFAVPQSDSVVIWIDDRPQNKITTLVSEYKTAGLYSIQIDLLYGDSSLVRKEGIIRLFFSIPSNTNFKTVHGDIQFKY